MMDLQINSEQFLDPGHQLSPTKTDEASMMKDTETVNLSPK